MAGIDLKSGYDSKTDPIFLTWKMTYYGHMYDLVDRILAAMKDFCTQQRINLVFAVGAIAQQLGPPSKSALINYDLPRDRFVALLRKNGIAYVDMVPPMLSAHTADDPVAFDDGHINDKGNRIFAETLHDQLGAKGWLN
jgi:hypothetical protein